MINIIQNYNDFFFLSIFIYNIGLEFNPPICWFFTVLMFVMKVWNFTFVYYSTLHKISNGKKFTKEEWDGFMRNSIEQALAERAKSSEVTNWIVEHADWIKLLPNESLVETMGRQEGEMDFSFLVDRELSMNKNVLTRRNWFFLHRVREQ